MAWFFPKPDPSDPMRNRRFMAYAALIYVLIYPLLVLAVYWFKGMDAATVTAFLGIVSLILTFIVKMYFDASKGDK